jgi:hypothetical protein
LTPWNDSFHCADSRSGSISWMTFDPAAIYILKVSLTAGCSRCHLLYPWCVGSGHVL